MNSKQSMSGLSRVTRDWSAPSSQTGSSGYSQPPSSDLSQSQSSQKDLPARRALTGVEQRLKDIQDALAGKTVSSERAVPSATMPNPTPSQSSIGSQGQKRPIGSVVASEPPAKKRVLPSSWDTPKPAPAASVSSRVSSQVVSVMKVSAPAVTTRKPAMVFLSPEQNQILKLVKEGKSIFYTGSAGTGKSVLLREIIKTMKKQHSRSPDAVAITASTGMAACNIGGVTIHSFAGIGLGNEPWKDLVTKIKKNKKATSRWLRTKVLIIDEVSMVEAELFDKLANIGGELIKKKSEIPFGGIQLIVTGDFFQLPPVVKSGETKFAFEAECWPKVIHRTFNLTKVFRQKDHEFVTMLNEMRFGKLTSKSISKFRALSRELEFDDGIAATELFPRREEVDRSNSTRMAQLNSETHTYRASHGGILTDPNQREKLLSNFMAPAEIRLSVGAQVMLIKNMDELLVNGSMGKIIRFMDPAAYAATTGDDDLKSAGKDKKGPPSKASISAGVIWPVVSFATPKGSVDIMVQPETWKVELPNGEVQVSRTQLPLILAWAMSIHKSQGQTLERVKVDLGKVFEKGQAYVALSRATSLEGLQVLNFDPAKVQAHPKVVTWCNSLETIQDTED